jgi:hypothetical protein
MVILPLPRGLPTWTWRQPGRTGVLQTTVYRRTEMVL